MLSLSWKRHFIVDNDNGLTYIRRSRIPPYLHSSVLYANLHDVDNDINSIPSDDCDMHDSKNYRKCDEDDEMIPIPTACMKMNLTLKSINDLQHLLSTLRFWSSPDIPDELFTYAAKAASRDLKNLRAAIADYSLELRYLDALVEVAGCRTWEEKLRIAASCGNISMLQHVDKKVRHNNNSSEINKALGESCCAAASERGHLSCLQYLHEHGYSFDSMTLRKAIENNHQSCALYAMMHCENKSIGVEILYQRKITKLSAALAFLGYLDCLQYLVTQQPSSIMIDQCTAAAAESGHLEVLKFLRSYGCPWTRATTREAAGGGHIDCLRYAHEHGCAWDASCCTAAARGGHLECLIYARESGCSWGSETMEAAVAHRDCLIYCRDNGCPCNPKVVNMAVRKGELDTLVYLHEVGGCPLPRDVLCSAAEIGNYDIFRYLFEHGAQLSRACCSRAAAGGHIDCLRFLLECKCPVDDMTTALAARYGHLECLQLARQHGCPWDADCCTWAAGNGHLECVKWAHEHGCPWSEWTPRAAAMSGQLEVLKYLHSEGCPWNHWTTNAACEANNSDCLQYAIDNGCAFNKETLQAYRQNEQIVGRNPRWCSFF